MSSPGQTGLDGPDTAAPAPLTAVTVNVCRVRLRSPVTSALACGAVTLVSISPGIATTLYSSTGPPSAGGVHATMADCSPAVASTSAGEPGGGLGWNDGDSAEGPGASSCHGVIRIV